jgi:hypothetical protein
MAGIFSICTMKAQILLLWPGPAIRRDWSCGAGLGQLRQVIPLNFTSLKLAVNKRRDAVSKAIGLGILKAG